MTDNWTKDLKEIMSQADYYDHNELVEFIAEQREKARKEEKRLWLLAITHLTSAQRESTLDTYEELSSMLATAPTKE